MATYKKDPNALLDYVFDWTAYLAPSGDTIDSVTWVTTAGLTVLNSVQTPTTAIAFVSGGVVGTTERLTCRITTTNGLIDDRSIDLKIVER